MGAIVPYNKALDNQLNRVKKLNSDCIALANLFGEEAIRLNRNDQASRLKNVLSSVQQRVEDAKRLEDAARSGSNEAHLVISSVGLLAGVAIGLASEGEQERAVSRYLLTNLGGKKRPFGTVLVCVGFKGLPDDVQVVRISELARDSHRQESDIISELRSRGRLLFSEEAFSRKVERLVDDVEEGRLVLPLPADKLVEPKNSILVRVQPVKPQWVPVPRQQ